MSRDPFDVLRGHVRRQADELEPGTSTDELVAHITLEHHRGQASPPARAVGRRRRWSSVVLATSVCLGLAAGAAVTAAVLDKGRVEVLHTAVLCRAAADVRSNAVLVDATDDPIAACRVLWNSGQLLRPDGTRLSGPALVGCTGPRGVLEVFPGDGPQVCADLGMVEADIAAMLDDPRNELQERVSLEINAKCLPPPEAGRHAESLLDELGFDGWNVVVDIGEGCGVVVIGEGDDHTLMVRVVTLTSG
jgi:hypothetical protein